MVDDAEDQLRDVRHPPMFGHIDAPGGADRAGGLDVMRIALRFRDFHAIFAKDVRDVGFANAGAGVVVGAVEEIGQRPATTLRRELGKFDDRVGYPWRFGILSPFGLQFGGRLRFWSRMEVFLSGGCGLVGIGLQPENDGKQDDNHAEGR